MRDVVCRSTTVANIKYACNRIHELKKQGVVKIFVPEVNKSMFEFAMGNCVYSDECAPYYDAMVSSREPLQWWAYFCEYLKAEKEASERVKEQENFVKANEGEFTQAMPKEELTKSETETDNDVKLRVTSFAKAKKASVSSERLSKINDELKKMVDYCQCLKEVDHYIVMIFIHCKSMNDSGKLTGKQHEEMMRSRQLITQIVIKLIQSYDDDEDVNEIVPSDLYNDLGHFLLTAEEYLQCKFVTVRRMINKREHRKTVQLKQNIIRMITNKKQADYAMSKYKFTRKEEEEMIWRILMDERRYQGKQFHFEQESSTTTVDTEEPLTDVDVSDYEDKAWNDDQDIPSVDDLQKSQDALVQSIIDDDDDALTSDDDDSSQITDASASK